MKAGKIIGNLLLGFVLISIGFAIGKEVTRAGMLSHTDAAPASAGAREKVVVYYMHATFRCVTCNLVESMGAELVRTEFADAVETGKLEWRAVNFQQNEQLAVRYKVGGNMIIVARFQDGKEMAHRRLDRVMELANKRSEYMSYVRGGLSEMLEGIQ